MCFAHRQSLKRDSAYSFCMTDKIKTVNCPTCGKPVEWRPENKFRPFCSERCKLIDLGEWATEKYRVPSDDGPGEEPGGGHGS
jgi:endogenous inhibitor of DNA gyrase (YacG/DUF329 family)